MHAEPRISTTPPAPAAPAPDLPPGLPADWVFDADLPCPSCRYNLRMLRTPRCPECGATFRWQALLHVDCPRCAASLEDCAGPDCLQCGLVLDWPKLLDPSRPRAVGRFEVEPRTGRALLSVLFRWFIPVGVWRRIEMVAAPVRTRLSLLRRTGLMVLLLGLALCIYFVDRYRVAPAFLFRAWYERYRISIDSALLISALTFSPWLMATLTALTIPRFTPTLMQFGIRREHFVRLTAYAGVCLFWLGVACALLAATFATVNRTAGPFAGWPAAWFEPRVLGQVAPWLAPIHAVGGWQSILDPSFAPTRRLTWLIFGTATLGVLWWWSCLWGFLRSYLRLDRGNAAALFLSTQIVALIIVSALLCAIQPALVLVDLVW